MSLLEPEEDTNADKYNDFSKGQTALEVMQTIVRHWRDIERVYLEAARIEETYWGGKYRTIRERALHIDEALDAKEGKLEICLRDHFLELQLDDLPKLSAGEMWTVRSQVGVARKKTKHVAMMHFEGGDDLATTQTCLVQTLTTLLSKPFLENGVLLNSGRSFHFYGDFLFTEANWPGFIGRILKTGVAISQRYVGYALEEGHASLRINSDDMYKPTIPRVVACLN